MKQHLIIFLFLLTYYSSHSQTEDKNKITTTLNNSLDIKISIDTLNISIDGNLKKVVLFKGNFYGMFETNRKNTTKRFKKMVVFNQEGTFLEDVFVPSEIQNMNYYDLKVQNDSLFLKESYFEKKNLYLDKYVADFKLTKSKDLKFYEDELYDVYATCNGEWGGTIYFKNKKTKETFEGSSTCPIVINKLANDYYVTNYMGHMVGFASVIKITDPTKLEKSEFKFNKNVGSEYKKGIEVLLDTMDFYISSSFVADKQLLHLYTENDGTYIGKLENKEMKPIFKFDFIFNAHFNQNLENGRQLLTCRFKDSERGGFLIIDGNNFQFYQQK